MQLIRGLSQLESPAQGCVLTIGNFDGLHLGHKAVIDKLVKRGKELGLPIVVLVFEPQPLEYFLADNSPSRLMRLREKVLEFATLPVDTLLIVPFNAKLANCNAEDFIETVLLEKLNIKHLVIGDDFHFGKARRGDFTLLKNYGKRAGFSVEDTGSIQIKNLRVSSTLVRDALNAGDLDLARCLLGRDFSIYGRVAHGDKRGRVLGFPTANIHLFRKNTPVNGVFAVTMTGIDGRQLQGVANVGTRPTVDGGSKAILETHLFNFDQEIYGRYVSVIFLQKIRNEQRFTSVEQLIAQIEKDVTETKNYFSARTQPS